MSYRIKPERHDHHHDKRTVDNLATPQVLKIINGSTIDVAYPCWYNEIKFPERLHHKDWHDHVGWPGPNYPDHICQQSFHHKHGYPYNPHAHHYVDLQQLIPIHLTEEGYEDVIVQTAITIPGLTAEGYIDTENDWVVRVHFDSQISQDIDNVLETKFAVRINNEDLGRTDTVAIGKLQIFQAPMKEVTNGSL